MMPDEMIQREVPWSPEQERRIAINKALLKRSYARLGGVKAGGVLIDATLQVSVIYANGGQRVWFTYTNWRGETSRRHVAMYGAFWRTTEWHPEPQWMLHAFDIEKDEPRIFAMRDIKDVTGDNHG